MKRILSTLALALAGAATALPAQAANQVVVLDIPGMHCAACPITIKHALSKVDGVKKTNIDLDGKEAWVTYDTERTNVAALTRATAEAGYPSTPKR